MAHVIKGHAMERVLAQYSVNAIASLVKTAGVLQNAAKQLATKYLLTSYSREHELEADLLGLNRNTLRKKIRELGIPVTRGVK